MGDSCLHYCSKVFSVFFEYDTPRIVHIKSKKVGIINRLLQLSIIGYVIGYAIVYKKGYQVFDDVRSSITTKVKGVARVDLNGKMTIMDVADYVVPPQENDAVFITTNLIRTEQFQSTCAEDPDVPDVNCTSDNDCPANESPLTGHGVFTGKCNVTTSTCMIYSWCPLETDVRPKKPVLEAAQNFTLFIKNNIEFPKFGVKRRNLLPNVNDTYLQHCAYERHDDDNFCPIFLVDFMVNKAGYKFETLSDQGGVIQIVIKWNCNLDHGLDECIPEYEFRRLDSSDYKISKGYNFRYATYFKENGQTGRDLTKAYGILFIILVIGKAGKFNIVPLMMNIGSGLALLSIATIVCDIFVLYVLKARNFYQKKKYLTVTGSDAYTIFGEHEESVNQSKDQSLS